MTDAYMSKSGNPTNMMMGIFDNILFTPYLRAGQKQVILGEKNQLLK